MIVGTGPVDKKVVVMYSLGGGEASERLFSNNHYDVFVLLTGVGSRPDFYIVPSKVVAEYVATTHSEWLASPKADGRPRKDSTIQNLRDQDGQYKEAWVLLTL